MFYIVDYFWFCKALSFPGLHDSMLHIFFYASCWVFSILWNFFLWIWRNTLGVHNLAIFCIIHTRHVDSIFYFQNLAISLFSKLLLLLKFFLPFTISYPDFRYILLIPSQALAFLATVSPKLISVTIMTHLYLEISMCLYFSME